MGLIGYPPGVFGAVLGRPRSLVQGDGVVRTKAFPSGSTGGSPYSPQRKSSGGTVHNGGSVSLASNGALSGTASTVRGGTGTLASAAALAGTASAIRKASGSVAAQTALAGTAKAIRKAAGGLAASATLTATGSLVGTDPSARRWRGRGFTSRRPRRRRR